MINFFEQLSDKLFPQKKDMGDAYDYNSITCLCGGSLIKDYQQGFKYCELCGTTDLYVYGPVSYECSGIYSNNKSVVPHNSQYLNPC